MAILPVSGTGLSLTGITGSHAADTPEKLKDAASQFEALLIGQILKTEHEDSGDGWGGDSADPASASAMDFANDYFARAMASKGGLGLTNMIVNGLNRQVAASE
ncbi:MAG TPA: hypothetical protein VE958_13195 [Bryobacteraceae bacterium]|jgi:Rod binding domain-containing protein|nr:hypothetical protein [Bryobacteraceae bacterium]